MKQKVTKISRKLLQLFLIGLFFFLIFPQPVLAHVLKSDGSVGAILHVTPDDDPVAGESTNFFFELKDRENKFTAQACNCTVIVLQGDREIFSQPLFLNNPNPSLDNASFAFTFPQKDIYKVKLVGEPSAPSAFESFTLEWDVRVAREANVANQSEKQTPQNTYIVLGSLLFFIAIFLFGQMRKSKKLTVFVVLFFFASLHILPASFVVIYAHHGQIIVEHPCCMPQATTLVMAPLIAPTIAEAVHVANFSQDFFTPSIFTSLTSRSPPFLS